MTVYNVETSSQMFLINNYLTRPERSQIEQFAILNNSSLSDHRWEWLKNNWQWTLLIMSDCHNIMSADPNIANLFSPVSASINADGCDQEISLIEWINDKQQKTRSISIILFYWKLNKFPEKIADWPWCWVIISLILIW